MFKNNNKKCGLWREWWRYLNGSKISKKQMKFDFLNCRILLCEINLINVIQPWWLGSLRRYLTVSWENAKANGGYNPAWGMVWPSTIVDSQMTRYLQTCVMALRSRGREKEKFFLYFLRFHSLFFVCDGKRWKNLL